MTIPEAAQLVIQSGAMGEGGDVLGLNMVEPVRIYDLARRMIELSGLSLRNDDDPQGDIEISVTSLRPGEKLFEELLIGNNPEVTAHPLILKDDDEFLSLNLLKEKLDILKNTIDSHYIPALRQMLKELVSDYDPQGEVVDWVVMVASGKFLPQTLH